LEQTITEFKNEIHQITTQLRLHEQQIDHSNVQIESLKSEVEILRAKNEDMKNKLNRSFHNNNISIIRISLVVAI
jgi:transcriptional regulator with AAA-type ATPase domain